MKRIARLIGLWLAAGWLCGAMAAVGGVRSAFGGEMPPAEPLEIGTAPQFVFDTYVIDNHWALKYKRQAVTRAFHQPIKFAGNPLLPGEDASYLWVVRDEESGLFRMWYQDNIRIADAALAPGPSPRGRGEQGEGRKYRTIIAYAESSDGIRWRKPDLDLFNFYNIEPNNAVLGRPEIPLSEACAPCILHVPERDRHGYRYLMMYRSKGRGGGEINGIRLIGSQDGIHWDRDSDTRIAHLHSDHHNTISYDPRRDEYVMFCRPKHIYRTFSGDILDTGASRRIARMTSKSLWTDWLKGTEPQTILIPDEIDAEQHFNFFYGMPTRYNAGLYWGFLEPFRMNDLIYTELATSRDGIHFQRLPGRPKLMEYGPDGSWDDTMIFASPSWVEVGDEWWFYYTGWDGPHGTTQRHGGIGLAKARKEGLISMHGPSGGGVLCTRKIRWPGGALLVNADAAHGELNVRISDADRKPIPGFDYKDCSPFSGDSVAHEMHWNGRSPRELAGRVIRLEFFLKDADLYTFRAGPLAGPNQ